MSVFCFEDIEIFPVRLTDGVRGGVHDVNLNSEPSMLDTRGCLRVRVKKNSLWPLSHKHPKNPDENSKLLKMKIDVPSFFRNYKTIGYFMILFQSLLFLLSAPIYVSW